MHDPVVLCRTYGTLHFFYPFPPLTGWANFATRLRRWALTVTGSVGALGFPFLFAEAAARSARMRSSSTDAGSSLGSWGTSLPEKARFRMAWRRRAARQS